MRRFRTALTVFGLSAMLVGGSIGCAGKKPPATDAADAAAAKAAADKAAAEKAAADKAAAAKAAAEKAAREAAEKAAREAGGMSGGSLVDVHFDYDRYNLTDMGKSVMAANAESVSKMGGKDLIIEGHCDDRGSDEYNLALGERRAETVRKYLVDYGVTATHLRTVSYGEERPVDAGQNETAWAKNRRAHLTSE